MTDRVQYTPGPTTRAQVRRTERSGRSFRDLRHSTEKVRPSASARVGAL